MLRRLSPYIRFINVFSYYPQNDNFVVGYDNRIFCVCGGSIILKFGNGIYRQEKNSAVFIPSGTPYKFEAADGKSCEILCINFDCVKSDFACGAVPPCDVQKFCKEKIFEKEKIREFGDVILLREATEICDTLFEINREYSEKWFCYAERCEFLLAAVLIDFLRGVCCVPTKDVELVRAVKTYLKNHACENITAELLGEIFHYHPNYINRVFKDNCGTTIHKFLIFTRIELAKQLLLSSNLSVEKIGLKCGFKTSAQFSGCFKKKTGVSPCRYRCDNEAVVI